MLLALWIVGVVVLLVLVGLHREVKDDGGIAILLFIFLAMWAIVYLAADSSWDFR